MPALFLVVALLAGPQHSERPARVPERAEAPDLPPIPTDGAATGKIRPMHIDDSWIALCRDGTHSSNHVRANNCHGHGGVKSDVRRHPILHPPHS